MSYGCITGDQAGALSAAYYERLQTLTFSVGRGWSVGVSVQLGLTLLIDPGQGVQRALQTDVSLEYSLSVLPLPFGATYMTTETRRHPTFVRPWNGQCGAEVTEQNAVEYVRDRMAGWMDMEPDAALEDSLARQVAEANLPLFDSLSASGEGGLADNVPAGSNGDYYAEFLSSPSQEISEDGPNTGADAVLLRSQDRVGAAGDDSRAILAAGTRSVTDLESNMPSVSNQATLQREAVTGARAVEELDGLNTLRASATQTFIAEEIKRVVAPSGEKVRVEVSAAEIAALLGRPVADVDGATIVVNAGEAIRDASFLLEGSGLALNIDVDGDGLLVRFDVDLSTAAGDFPEEASRWIVRPAMYAIEIEAGPAAGVLLTGPGQLASGGPASLEMHSPCVGRHGGFWLVRLATYSLCSHPSKSSGTWTNWSYEVASCNKPTSISRTWLKYSYSTSCLRSAVGCRAMKSVNASAGLSNSLSWAPWICF